MGVALTGGLAGEYAEERREGWRADKLHVRDIDCTRKCQTGDRVDSFTALHSTNRALVILGSVLTQ